jgi:hypothetical protein
MLLSAGGLAASEVSRIRDTLLKPRGGTMKSMSKFGADRIVAGAIVVTIIALIAMYINGTWIFPFP